MFKDCWTNALESQLLVAVYASISLAVLVVTVTHHGDVEPSVFRWSLAANAMSLAAAFSLVVLSSLEHMRSPRPSNLIAIYLFLTTLFDVSRARTAWLQAPVNHNFTYARLLTATVASKAAVLLVEAKTKGRWLVTERKCLSPEETSSIFSIGVFFWLSTLFRRGYRGMLQMENLYPLDARLLSRSIPSRFVTKFREDSSWRGKSWGLPKAVFSSLALELSLPIIPRVVLLASTLCQSFLVDGLVRYLEIPRQNRQREHGYGLIGATVLVYGTIATSTAIYWYFQERFAALVRSNLVVAVYEKSTELKSVSGGGGDSAVITLMSTDVERIQMGVRDIHEYWANLAQAIIACYFLHRLLGAAFAVPLVIVALAAMSTSLLGRLMGRRQRAWMAAIQHRVSVTADAIAQIKLLKMAGMAVPVQDMVQALRVEEIGYGSRWRLLVAIAATISHAQGLLAPVFTFAITSATLNTSTIFVSLSYMTLLTSPLISLLQKLPQLLGAWTCLCRIQAFLEREPRVDYRCARGGGEAPSVIEPGVLDVSGDCAQFSTQLAEIIPDKYFGESHKDSITIKGGYFAWDEEKPILQDVNITIPGSRLTIISGPVASGKSTLCKALLGEIPFASGTVTVPRNSKRQVGYCEQQPCLFNASIKDNIIGHGHFDAQRYDHVLQATRLSEDISDFPLGSDTIIGNRGIVLSGGQRQRLSIARALYAQRTDLLIFDDVLSGLDAGTEDDVFRNVFGKQGWVRRHGLTAILCLHDSRRFDDADHFIRIKEGGVVEEMQQPGSIDDTTTTFCGSGPELPLHDASITGPSHTAPAVAQAENNGGQNASARQAGDWSIYKHYYQAAGALPYFVFIAAAAGNGFLNNFPRVWLSFWSDDVARGSRREHPQSYYIGIYGLLQVACLLCGVVAAITVFLVIIRRSGANLHERALKTVIDAPLRFFTTVDTGILINYFSQDITLIDGELPIALINMVVEFFGVVGTAAVLASSAPFLALVYPVLFVVLWFLQRFYLRTSRQLRLLDLEAKSPLYSHFLDTVKGLTTIRAFGWTSHHIAHNMHLLDESQRPAYLLYMSQRLLYFWLSVIMMVLATGLITLTTQLGASSSLSGASFTSLMTLSESLRDLVRFYASLETSIGAVARLRAFTEDTPNEQEPGRKEAPPKLWPSAGSIDMSNVDASYSYVARTIRRFLKLMLTVDIHSGDEKECVIRNLDLTIRAGEKIALCGRTGR